MVTSLEGAMSDNRHGKMETYYGPMIYGGYPLMYAVMLDIKSRKPTSLTGLTSKPDIPAEAQIELMTTAQEGNQALLDANIPLVPLPFKETFFIDSKLDGNSLFIYGATTESDLRVFTGGHKALVTALNACFNDNSYTQQVLRQLAATHPELDSAFMLDSATRAVLDGFLSTYEAAAHLSRTQTEGSTDNAYERLLRILRSSVPTTLTKKLQASVLTNMGLLAYAPEKSTQLVGGQITLHPEILPFLHVVNDALSSDLPHPLLCPFAIPLGNRVEDALAYFGGEQNLPAEVVQMMKQNNLVPGITSVGSSIANIIERSMRPRITRLRRSNRSS